MESPPANPKIDFDTVRARLIAFVRARINSGDLSERGLARILGISQSHVHNVLKGARRLQPELGDRLMKKFGLTILDLLQKEELKAINNASLDDK